jgi:hypothetical protein
MTPQRSNQNVVSEEQVERIGRIFPLLAIVQPLPERVAKQTNIIQRFYLEIKFPPTFKRSGLLQR